MTCRRCPHFVRHGKVAADQKSIEFENRCGLKMKANEGAGTGDDTCYEAPFPPKFDYMHCQVYRETFKSGIQKNDVVPTKDIQYSEVLNSGSITDMELL